MVLHWSTFNLMFLIPLFLYAVVYCINRDSGIENPGGWMPTIKQHNRRSVPQRPREGTASSQNNEDRNPLIINNDSEDRNAAITISHGAVYNETQHPCDNIVRQTINKLLIQND